MDILFYILAFTSLMASVLLVISMTGYQASMAEFLLDQLRSFSGSATTSNAGPTKPKTWKPGQKLLSNLTKTQKTIILTLLCLANAISITLVLVVFLGDSNIIFLIIGTSASIFDILLVFLSFILDKI